MQAMVMADRKFSVSYKNKILASIPADKKSMLNEIAGKTIIYDIHFLTELPGQMPVKGCRNIIYTDGIRKTVKGAECYETLGALGDAIESIKKNPQVYIIHGAALYNEFYKDVDVFHVTKIDYEYKADASIPDLDKDPEFTITADSDEMYCFDIIYEFLKYERKCGDRK